MRPAAGGWHVCPSFTPAEILTLEAHLLKHGRYRDRTLNQAILG